jgi:hypothetical protein
MISGDNLRSLCPKEFKLAGDWGYQCLLGWQQHSKGQLGWKEDGPGVSSAFSTTKQLTSIWEDPSKKQQQKSNKVYYRVHACEKE